METSYSLLIQIKLVFSLQWEDLNSSALNTEGECACACICLYGVIVMVTILFHATFINGLFDYLYLILNYFYLTFE